MHTAQCADCTYIVSYNIFGLQPKGLSDTWAIGIVLKHNLQAQLSELKLKLGVFFGEQALLLLTHLSLKGE